jgi:hypothetical protein
MVGTRLREKFRWNHQDVARLLIQKRWFSAIGRAGEAEELFLW